MLHALAALPRRLRWALRHWSPAADRDFHDALFAAQRYDPFSFAYPGYLTIRRFADLTEPHLAGVRHAVDFGCGPGEITCELARRNPANRFTGVDHSESAIARAREHKDRLKLTNVDFIAADVSTFSPDHADIVLMYDSFHHLLDPAGFVRRLAPHVRQFVLVEPAGDWLGGWQRTVELDWIPNAVDAIRARLAWQLSLDGSRAATPSQVAEERGEPVEHRYPVPDLQRFFDGYGLDIRGTFAGIDQYPPDPYAALPLREEFGRIAYTTLSEIEEVLVKQDLDLHAKHWLVHAERGAPHRVRTPRPVNPRTNAPESLMPAGQYDVEYVNCSAPPSVAAGATFHVDVTLKNRGWRPWRSDDPASPVLASYHWLNADGTMAVEDGARTPMPRPLAPGETLAMTCVVTAPARAGVYTLAIDLVEEGVTWFSRAGAAMRRQRIVVNAPSRR
jgi:SAM-dependent methyltransferase